MNTTTVKQKTPAELVDIDQHQFAMMNILEDFSADKELMDNSQKAVLNILEDVSADKELMEQTQKAMLNILEDSTVEKRLLEDMQKAVVNILDDYAVEIERIEQMNRELEEVRDSLEERVSDRTAELKHSNEELESFSYSVSHDLRAPLRAIAGFSGVLEEDYADKLGEDGRKVIAKIERNAHKMSVLIDDILAFSRLGRREMNVQELPMYDIFSSVFEEAMQGYDRKDITFKLGQIEPAHGDRGMVVQLVTNLVSNALKYSEPKSNPEIEIRGDQRGNEYVYSVIDNGVGFNEKYSDKLFGVFQRLHGEHEFEGTGVGLAIAHRVAKNHNGRIWASSTLGEGSSFYFTLNT